MLLFAAALLVAGMVGEDDDVVVLPEAPSDFVIVPEGLAELFIAGAAELFIGLLWVDGVAGAGAGVDWASAGPARSVVASSAAVRSFMSLFSLL
jgi:hypothetical protein